VATLLYAHISPELLIADLAEIKSLNFDVVYGAAFGADYSGVPDILDACEAAGLKLILNVRVYCETNWASDSASSTASLTTYAGLYGSHPAFYGWYTCDEADGSSYGVTQRQQVYTLLKSLTPDALVFEAEYANVHDSYRATGTHDVFAGDLYPFQSGRSVASALSVLANQTGSTGIAAGTTDFMTSIGGGANDLSWCVQVWSQTAWPPPTGVAAEVAALETAGWLSSGHLWAFVWIDDSYPPIPSSSSLRGAPSAFKAEVAAAIAPYQESAPPPPPSSGETVYVRYASAWSSAAVNLRSGGAWIRCGVVYRHDGEWT
jgi:hypothetical protein